MDPLTVAAQFAAYSWFNEYHAKMPTVAEAMKFARENWPAFVNDVPKSLGRFLIRVGRLDEQRRGRKHRASTRRRIGTRLTSVEAAG